MKKRIAFQIPEQFLKEHGILDYIRQVKAKTHLSTSNLFCILLDKLFKAGEDPFGFGVRVPENTLSAHSPPRPSGPTEEQRAMQRAMRAKYEAEQAEKNKTKETP